MHNQEELRWSKADHEALTALYETNEVLRRALRIVSARALLDESILPLTGNDQLVDEALKAADARGHQRALKQFMGLMTFDSTREGRSQLDAPSDSSGSWDHIEPETE